MLRSAQCITRAERWARGPPSGAGTCVSGRKQVRWRGGAAQCWHPEEVICVQTARLVCNYRQSVPALFASATWSHWVFTHAQLRRVSLTVSKNLCVCSYHYPARRSVHDTNARRVNDRRVGACLYDLRPCTASRQSLFITISRRAGSRLARALLVPARRPNTSPLCFALASSERRIYLRACSLVPPHPPPVYYPRVLSPLLTLVQNSILVFASRLHPFLTRCPRSRPHASLSLLVLVFALRSSFSLAQAFCLVFGSRTRTIALTILRPFWKIPSSGLYPLARPVHTALQAMFTASTCIRVRHTLT